LSWRAGEGREEREEGEAYAGGRFFVHEGWVMP